MMAEGLSALLALALQAPPAPAPPTVPSTMPIDLAASFVGAEQALARVSACIATPGFIMTPVSLNTLDNRFQALARDAVGVWGPQTPTEIVDQLPVDCASEHLSALATTAETQVTRVATRMTALLQPMSTGLWFGALPLCGGGLVKAELVADSYTAAESVTITLSPDKAIELGTLTRRHVGHALALREGGRVVMEPIIQEPIEGGQVQISGPERDELDRVIAAAEACKR